MKVLMINSVCGIRSTGRICTDLAVELEKQGHEVKIAYGRESVPEQFQRFAVRIGTNLDVKLHGLKARAFDAMGFGSKRATKKFIEWVKEYDPDVIHLHNIHGYYINIEILFDYLKTCGKRIIWTLHDCWAFTGHSAYCDAIDCTRWKTGCYDCPQKNVYPKSFTDRSKSNWKRKEELFTGIPNLTIVTPSNWLKVLVQESYLKEYPTTVIHNGVDTSIFKPVDSDFRDFYHLPNQFIILGSATEWSDLKGFSDYIKLSELLNEEYKVVLLGLTDQQIQKLPKNILGIKKTNSVKELVSIISAANLFLNLTYCDNYPTVNIEAIACGIPVLSYDTGGSSESANLFGSTIVKGDLSLVCKKIQEIRKSYPNNNSNIQQLDKKETVTRYNGIYCNNSYSEKSGVLSVRSRYNVLNKIVILGVAAIWEKRKGLDDFIKLSRMLDKQYVIVLVGLNEEQQKNLPDNVISINVGNNVGELIKLYSAADVFVNPTYEDNYPTVNLEAISCGTPVVTYNTGGSPESADCFGTAVPKGDIKALYSAIKSIDRFMAVNNNFDKSYMISEYIKIY